jgi:putative DNA primase/helicase
MKYNAKKVTDEEIRKAALKNVKRTSMAQGKNNMIKEAQHLDGIPVLNSDFDKERYLLNTEGGVVDLKRKKMIKHDSKLMLSKIAPYTPSYDEPKLWIKFLNEVFENDQEVIDYMQRIFGYAMTSDTTERCIFFFVGDGMNGKSVLLDVLRQVLGSYALTSNVNILLDKKNQGGSNMGDVARLNGMRCVITNEAEITDKIKESAIKTITSGNDNITARFLYGSEFEFTPECKIFMATNYKPRIIGVDLGIWSRIKILTFNVTFDEQHQDKNLKDKLMTEADKILGWKSSNFVYTSPNSNVKVLLKVLLIVSPSVSPLKEMLET